jgi:hypothetical protein
LSKALPDPSLNMLSPAQPSSEDHEGFRSRIDFPGRATRLERSE